MKKIILGIVLVIVIAIGIAGYYLFTNLDSLVEAAIEEYGSRATQTAVRVDKVRIKLSDGAGTISGLSVANPKGFVMPLAFSLGEIRARIDLKSLKHEPYIIDEITVRAPQVFMEINQHKKTNLNEIKNNVTASVLGTKTKHVAADKSKPKEPLLIIRRIVFADGNIQAKVVPLNNKEYQLKLPSLTMTNLGGKHGATPTQITKEILTRLTDQVREEIRKKGIAQELDKLKDQARAKVEVEKAKLKGKVDSKMEAEKQKAMDKLKGMFGK